MINYFSCLLEEIEKAKSNSSLIVVEGKKDRTALEQIGLRNIFILNENGKSIYEKIEEISQNKSKEVILLMDIDKKGKSIYFLMKRHFSQNGIKMNNRIRDLMIKMKISHVEGLNSFIKHYQLNNSYPKSS